MNEQKKLMKLIQRYSFAVTEAVLYLDTHSNCRRALAFYNKYNRLYREAVETYEKKYGMITMYPAADVSCWNWVETPWPWEA